MEDKKHTNPKGIVVENVARGQVLRLRMQKLLMPLSIGIAVLAIAGGGWYWWTQSHKTQSPDIKLPTRTAVAGILDGSVNPSDPASKDQLEKAAQEATDPKDKALAYDALATNADARQDYNTKVDSLIKSYEAGAKDSAAALAIADTYENQLQDYNNALKYYRIAQGIAQNEQKQGDPYANGQLRYINESIARMEAKGAH